MPLRDRVDAALGAANGAIDSAFSRVRENLRERDQRPTVDIVITGSSTSRPDDATIRMMARTGGSKTYQDYLLRRYGLEESTENGCRTQAPAS
jgi:hypothetical protein